MLIEDHYFLDPREILVDDVQVFNRIGMTNKLLEQPIIVLKYRQDKLTITGKSLMWDMLDALYTEPLPRNPVNDDIFKPTLATDPAHEILDDLIAEADANYICFLVDKDLNVDVVCKDDRTAPDMVLRGIADMVGQWSTIYPVMHYVNKTGSHKTKTAVFSSQYGNVVVWDLGHKLLFTCFTTLPNGVAVAPRGYSLLRKEEDMFYDVSKNMVEMMMASLKAARHTIKKVDPSIWQDWRESSYMRTLETDTIAHDRWLKLGGWV